MLEKIVELSAVSYCLFNEKVFCSVKNSVGYSIDCYDLNGNLLDFKLPIKSKNVLSFYSSDDYFVVSINDESLIYFIDINNHISIINGVFKGFTSNGFIITKKDNDERRIIHLGRGLNSGFEVVNSAAIFPVINEEWIIFRDFLSNSNIGFLNLKKKEVSQKFDASSFGWTNINGISFEGEIYQVIGILENQLILHLAPSRIVAVNLTNGEVLWEIKDFVRDNSINKFLLFDRGNRTPMFWHLKKEKNVMFLLARFFLWKLDLKTNEVELKKSYLGQSSKERWNFTRTTISKDGIYFAGTKGFGFASNYIGFFDFNKNDVTWEYSLDQGYFKESPRLMNGYLYALDSLNKLSVFKLL